jgi:ribosomal protein S18 acetylase RimI-like enzyme
MSHVRPATPEDLAALARVLTPLELLTRYGHSATGFEKTLRAAHERGDGLLVWDDGAPRGLAWYLSRGTFGVGGYLRLLAVAPEVHRRGVGAQLLHAYEAGVFAASAHAFLLVSDFNHAAQRFYERHGYQRTGALPGLVLPDVTELIYWKRRPASDGSHSGSASHTAGVSGSSGTVS